MPQLECSMLLCLAIQNVCQCMSFPIRVKMLKVMDWFPSTLYSGFPKQSRLLHKAKHLCTTQMFLASQGWKSLPALLGKLCALIQGLKNKVWVSIPLPDKAFISKFFFWRWFLYYYYFIWFDSTYISSPISQHLSFFKQLCWVISGMQRIVHIYCIQFGELGHIQTPMTPSPQWR